MEEKNDLLAGRSDSPARSSTTTIEYIYEGQLCPNCGFARLAKEPGSIIRCPVCGYGNGSGCG